jgi:hypothetical protein
MEDWIRMDADRFDALIRALPNGSSRRRALGTALGGFLGFLGLAGEEARGADAAKKCKKLKGKKKKKCLKKAKGKTPECRKDADCRDQIESCQGGRCQRVCPNGACPGCDLCLIRYEADGDRTRRCAGSAQIPALLTACDTDTDCPDEAPLCVSFAEISCTNGPCGTCVVATGSCDEPECQNDADCTDRTESCQGGECRPVCPNGACPGCNFCLVHFAAGGDRTAACADSFSSVSADPVSCTTDASCPGDDPTCILVSTVVCAQPPCCFSLDICAP